MFDKPDSQAHDRFTQVCGDALSFMLDQQGQNKGVTIFTGNYGMHAEKKTAGSAELIVRKHLSLNIWH